MSMDGCFIHYLVYELNEIVKGSKINRIYQPSSLDVILEIRTHKENQKLLLSSKLNAPRVHLTNVEFQNPESPTNFCMILRKYIERGIITSINQHTNDRIIDLVITTFNELEDEKNYHLIIELMGRNSNIILTNDEFVIIDAIRKLPPSLDNERTIIPHSTYYYPAVLGTINLFEDCTNLDEAIGLSKSFKVVLSTMEPGERYAFLHQNIRPVIYQNGTKLDFYAYPLDNDSTIIKDFTSLSNLLDEYYLEEGKVNNSLTLELTKFSQKELKKALNKKDLLLSEISKSKDIIKDENYAVLLQSNLYKVQKGMDKIVVNDYFNNNIEVTIELNPLLEPSANLKKYFTKIKKAKTSLIMLDAEIKKLDEDIDYYNDILFQLSIGNKEDIEYIHSELISLGLMKAKQKSKIKKQSPSFNSFDCEDYKIIVGKNNIQNDYLTNKYAASSDYWFHVKDIPGSHVIVKPLSNNGPVILNEQIIRFAANVAAFYSKASTSSSVPVDYTQVKYIKKIPGVKGFHVTYTHQQTIYIDPIDPYKTKK